MEVKDNKSKKAFWKIQWKEREGKEELLVR